jgi:hypothetical protein
MKLMKRERKSKNRWSDSAARGGGRPPLDSFNQAPLIGVSRELVPPIAIRGCSCESRGGVARQEGREGGGPGQQQGRRERGERQERLAFSLLVSSLPELLLRARASLAFRSRGFLRAARRRDVPWSLEFDRNRRARGS